jgi:hypothetical protein
VGLTARGNAQMLAFINICLSLLVHDHVPCSYVNISSLFIINVSYLTFFVEKENTASSFAVYVACVSYPPPPPEI